MRLKAARRRGVQAIKGEASSIIRRASPIIEPRRSRQMGRHGTVKVWLECPFRNVDRQARTAGNRHTGQNATTDSPPSFARNCCNCPDPSCLQCLPLLGLASTDRGPRLEPRPARPPRLAVGGPSPPKPQGQGTESGTSQVAPSQRDCRCRDWDYPMLQALHVVVYLAHGN